MPSCIVQTLWVDEFQLLEADEIMRQRCMTVLLLNYYVEYRTNDCTPEDLHILKSS